MYSPGLFDGCFPHQRSASLGGDNQHIPPELVAWRRGEYGKYSTFYTDTNLDKAIGAHGLKVAWLIEPPSLSDAHYRKVIEMEDIFDYILTFDTHLLERGDKWMYYPIGGSWVGKWGMYPKSKRVSIIASGKTGACGHRLRHEIVRRYHGLVDALGSGYTPLASKKDGLAPYQYSIVVESIRMDTYFTEKLIDCLSCGTIPIYWGCPSVGDFFDESAILSFTTLEELDGILADRTRDYSHHVPAIRGNLQVAGEYACTENWLVRHYPFLFEGTK